MEGLYQRGKVWWLRFTPAPGAAQHRQSLETQDEAVAIVKAREVQQRASTQMRAQMQECPAERDRYLAVMHRERELTESTLKFRKAAINHLVKFTQATTPRQITPRQVNAWVDTLKKQNPETAINYLSVAQSWFTWLQQGFKINSNPASQVKPPKKPAKGRKQFLRPEEARKLITAATGDRDLTFALYCALHAGLRRKEVIEARPSWFDLSAGLLHVQATPTFVPKDKDNRTIPLTKEFRDWLRKNYTMQEPFMLSPERTHGKSPYRYNFGRIYERLLERAELSANFHDLRRTFASLHVSKGTSVYKVAQWLGDGVVVVQRTYGHLLPQDDQINDIWETTPQPAAPDTQPKSTPSPQPASPRHHSVPPTS